MECQICFETFDSKNFVPKMLISCGHSFCKICLERLINKKSTVQCPICRESTKIQNTKDSLPTNYSLVEIIDKSRDIDATKSILEKYKYFDDKSYANINSKIVRYYEPRILELKKIVNDDFIYVEEFENNQNISIFNTLTKRNRRYNFNRNSLLRFFFNEYSYTICLFRKASKCRHSGSCFESIMKRIFYSVSLGLISYYPLSYILNKPLCTEWIKDTEKAVKYGQIGISAILGTSKIISCLVSFYIDELLTLN